MPLSIVHWTKGMTLLFKDKHDLVEFYKDIEVKSAKESWPVPAVIRGRKYIKRNYKKVPFNRKNVYLRDKMTCQYCGQQFDNPKDLTYDHVIPRSKWKKAETPTNWENIVTSCLPCNSKKADRTPEQAGMVLKKQPKKPTYTEYVMGFSPWNNNVPEEWRPYISSLPHFKE